MLGELLLLIYLYDEDAISTHISVLCVILLKSQQKNREAENCIE